MEALPVFNLSTVNQEVEKAAAALGKLLSEQPSHKRFIQAIADAQKNPQVRDLSSEIHTTRGTADLERLNQELEALPIIQEYRAAESATRQLFHAINALLSESLKADFASNAKRGCGCGG